jgi:hypothetical protein
LTPALDGRWHVRRTGGLLPPLLGVGKTIAGSRGHTTLGPLRVPFLVEDLTLRYEGLLRGLEDRLEPDGPGFKGRSYVYGVELGRFELRRA